MPRGLFGRASFDPGRRRDRRQPSAPDQQNWWERPCLYTAVVGPPGSAKSPALKLVATPFYQEQNHRMGMHWRQMMAWEETEGQGRKPKPSIVCVNDVTCEALARILQDNPRGVALIRDELTAWVMAMDQYKSKGRGSDRQFYLSAWAGEPVAVDRVTQEAGRIHVPHPFVSVCGCLPPDLLSRFQGERAIADGFLDRLLFASPEPTLAVGETWRAVSEEASQTWKERLSSLFKLEMDTDEEGEKWPKAVHLNSAGRAAWERFTNHLAEEMNEQFFPDFLRGPWSKMKGYCARLSLIVHYLRKATGEADGEEVDGEDMERAGAIVAYFQSHARKVYAALDTDPEIEDAKRVLDWILRERRQEFKRYMVFEDLKRRFSRIEGLDLPLDRLEKHKVIRRQDLPKGGGRPPDPVWLINPLIYAPEKALAP